MDYQPKLLQFDKESRKSIARGADKLAKAVISTLGPRSKNVAIHMGGYAPRVIHDGVSVAREIRLKDRFEDLGCMLIREAATKTNDLAGDGTTTATLLANTLIQEGMNLIDEKDDQLLTKKQGVQSEVLREALLKFSEIINKEIDKMTKKIETDEELEQIAVISSADKELGKVIAQAWSKIGVNGQVIVENVPSYKDEAEISQGYNFDNGYMSGYFVTDQARKVIEYPEAYVLFADYKFFGAMDLIDIVSEVFENKGTARRPLIIVANDVQGACMNALIQTRIRLGYEIAVVMAPEFAERQQQALDDMALLTGGVVANPQTLPINDVHVQHLGRVRNVLITHTETSFTPDSIDNEELSQRIEDIKKQVEEEKTEWIKDKLKERLARLSQSIAILKVRGDSGIEFDNRRERAIDAVFAVRAALTDGIVPGGGITLMQIAKNLGSEETAGLLPEAFDLVLKTLRRPFEVLLENSAISVSDIETKIDWKKKTEGYDVVKREVVDTIKTGIVDPAKVTKLAVTHAFSVAATILTTACAIVDEVVEDGKRNV